MDECGSHRKASERDATIVRVAFDFVGQLQKFLVGPALARQLVPHLELLSAQGQTAN